MIAAGCHCDGPMRARRLDGPAQSAAARSSGERADRSAAVDNSRRMAPKRPRSRDKKPLRSSTKTVSEAASQRRSERRRTLNKIEFEYDSFKETQLLQQAMKASLITKHAGDQTGVAEAPVFRPTPAEFMDPFSYIESIRDQVEYDAGICKIIPPRGWNPPPPFPDDKKDKFPTRIQLIHRLQEGIGFDSNDAGYTIKEYKEMADSFYREFFGQEPGSLKSEDVEERYWKIVKTATPEVTVEYGNDIDASVFGSGFPTIGSSKYVTHPWNMNNIARLPGSVIRRLEGSISGVTVPWVYFGMLFSSFCWHAEDLWMYSVNYNHMGAPKTWYGAPGCDHKKVEAAMKAHAPELFSEEPDLAMKLVTQVPPAVLLANNVSVVHAVQHAGEFIVTFPRAFHAGFNQGFNCTEAVNFATIDWLEHGRCSSEEYRRFAKPPVFSHEKLVINLVQSDAHIYDKDILEKELSKLIETQLQWRGYWKRTGITDWMSLSPRTDNPVHTCDSCYQFCFLSFLKCSCDSKRIDCLHHIGEGAACKCPPSRKVAYFRYTIDELCSLKDSLVCR